MRFSQPIKLPQSRRLSPVRGFGGIWEGLPLNRPLAAVRGLGQDPSIDFGNAGAPEPTSTDTTSVDFGNLGAPESTPVTTAVTPNATTSFLGSLFGSAVSIAVPAALNTWLYGSATGAKATTATTGTKITTSPTGQVVATTTPKTAATIAGIGLPLLLGGGILLFFLMKKK
jgi:hypothetical protein